MRALMLLAAAIGFAAVVDAQTPPPAPAIKRTLLQRFDLSPDREVIVGMAEIPPGMAAGRHTHFGPESGYVLEGTSSLEIEGETPKLLKAGDSYVIPAGKVHDAKAVGDHPVKVIATYIVEKGKPLATAAPSRASRIDERAGASPVFPYTRARNSPSASTSSAHTEWGMGKSCHSTS